ncbi:MAG: hypothetical protein KGS45_13690 [Planctomycetes bacterium]|nr:hypothetical protein [Planctomycetota bacterium]
MGREIGAMALSLIVSRLLMILLLFLAYAAIGVERTFEAGAYTVTPLWLTILTLVGVASLMVAGYVCRAICKQMKTVQGLAILFLVFGMVAAASNLRARDPGPRAGEVTFLDAFTDSVKPTWYSFTMPVLAYVAILIGGGFKKEPPLTNPKVA